MELSQNNPYPTQYVNIWNKMHIRSTNFKKKNYTGAKISSRPVHGKIYLEKITIIQSLSTCLLSRDQLVILKLKPTIIWRYSSVVDRSCDSMWNTLHSIPRTTQQRSKVQQKATIVSCRLLGQLQKKSTHVFTVNNVWALLIPFSEVWHKTWPFEGKGSNMFLFTQKFSWPWCIPSEVTQHMW